MCSRVLRILVLVDVMVIAFAGVVTVLAVEAVVVSMLVVFVVTIGVFVKLDESLGGLEELVIRVGGVYWSVIAVISFLSVEYSSQWYCLSQSARKFPF